MDAIPHTFPIWPSGASGIIEGPDQETPAHPEFNIRVIRNVTQPTLSVFLPDPAKATGTAAIVCPGGGFHFLAIDHEGLDVAAWLNARGIAAFVLHYRLIPTEADDDAFRRQLKENMTNYARMEGLRKRYGQLGIEDAQQALRLVRERAAEWSINPQRIGIMGFSAGGAVTVGAMIDYDAQSRPDFAAPIYSAAWAVEAVPEDAPPIFIAVASDDAFATLNCVPLYTAWLAAGRSAELHSYAKGGHGFGMFTRGIPTDTWIERFGEWLSDQGF